MKVRNLLFFTSLASAGSMVKSCIGNKQNKKRKIPKIEVHLLIKVENTSDNLIMQLNRKCCIFYYLFQIDLYYKA